MYLPDEPLPSNDEQTRQSDESSSDEQPAEPVDDDEPAPETTPEETPNPPPVVQPSGTVITEEGIKSTYEVTQAMLDDSNFETLEHITVRVWIEHQRRGDVEVDITSPQGVTSVLARVRRFDESTDGFPGWKFMSLKHW